MTVLYFGELKIGVIIMMQDIFGIFIQFFVATLRNLEISQYDELQLSTQNTPLHFR